MPRGIDLRRHYARQSLAVERLDDTIVEHPSRMHDRAQRAVVRDRRERCLQLPPVRDVTRLDRDRTTQALELGNQLAGALRLRPRATDKQQALDTVLDHQMPSDQRTQTTGPAGHQHGPRAESACVGVRGRGCRRLDQSRSQ
jgi:hypothetical protein